MPKRLRPYFRVDRKLLSLFVQAAHEAFGLAVGNGRSDRRLRTALITPIQRHGDELNWNCHLHLLVADGGFDTADPEEIRFHLS